MTARARTLCSSRSHSDGYSARSLLARAPTIAAFPGTHRHLTKYEAHNDYLRLRGSEHRRADGAAAAPGPQIQPQAQAAQAAAAPSHGVSKRDDAAALRVARGAQGYPDNGVAAEPVPLDGVALPHREPRRILCELPARVAGGAGAAQCTNQIVATTVQPRHRRDAGSSTLLTS